MKKYYSFCCIIFLGFYSVSVLADEWFDVARDIQKHITTEMVIPPVLQEQMNANLLWAYACNSIQESCSTEKEKQFMRENIKNLEELAIYYKTTGIKKPTLEYVVSQVPVLRAMTQENVAPMGPVMADILLQAYYDYSYKKYEIFRTQEEAKQTEQMDRHQSALKYLPKGAIIPNIPLSKTQQAVVIDLSDQRLYAFEDGMLVYTNPITSGKNGYKTVVGDFSIMNKQKNRRLNSPFKNQHYSLHVDYWIQFYPKYGIHDACNSVNCWRKEFGGPDYTTRGSHGCVNSPYEAVKWLYDWSIVGTAVRVQK